MIFKSVHFPNEVVATRRGSPLLIGVKTPKKLKVDFVDVEFGATDSPEKRKSLISVHPYSHSFFQSMTRRLVC